jgi:hypothetical protein
MSLADAVEIPEELKDQVSQRLKATGALRKLTREVKVAMTAAIAELKGIRASSRDSDPGKSVLTHDGLNGSDELEKRALQAVYSFLRAHGMTYTLETLQEESAIDDQGDGADLGQLFSGVAQTMAQTPTDWNLTFLKHPTAGCRLKPRYA